MILILDIDIATSNHHKNTIRTDKTLSDNDFVNY